MEAMQLKHLNLTVSDVSGLTEFFERHFGFKRSLELGAGAFTLMTDNDDFVLALMKPKKNGPVSYPETFHLGFFVADLAAVQAKHDELEAAGLVPGKIHNAGRTGRGAYFYCNAPGDVVVEIATAPALQTAQAS
jgi:catechol 2,3-dioxygenase-like lactoylglutathione lyase family enzyme